MTISVKKTNTRQFLCYFKQINWVRALAKRI